MTICYKYKKQGAIYLYLVENVPNTQLSTSIMVIVHGLCKLPPFFCKTIADHWMIGV
jgi:hypothetical protein